MTRGFRAGVVVGGILVAMIAAGVFYLNDGAAEKRVVGLFRDSLEAARDTTRRMELEKGVLGATVQLLQRRSIQTAQRADSLDHALKQERKARARIEVQFAALDTTLPSAPSILHGDTRIMRWDAINRPPYIIDSLKVTSPPPPRPALLELYIRHYPVPMNIRLGCGAPNPDNYGIRPAYVNIEVPTWAQASIADVGQTPDVCNAPRPHTKTRLIATLATGGVLFELGRRAIRSWLR